MRRPTVTSFVSALLFASAGHSIETVNHVNDAALLPVGARSAGVAGVGIGLAGDPSHLASSPAGLADVERAEVVVHHASLYEDLALSQDEIYLAAPLSYGTLGLGISRIGADGILRAQAGQAPDFADPSTFSATDWIASLAFARTWFDRRLRAGASLRVLGRDIDSYYGAGAQLDASAVWLQDGFRAGLRLDRGIGGLATWESGYTEYTPPDLMLGVGYERRLPYFYGTGALAWETSGLLREQSASSFSQKDARPWVDPWLFLRSSRLAGEFRFDMGLVLRAGCEIQSLTRLLDFLQGEDQQGQFGDSKGSVSAGAGYLWSNRLRIDYALSAHPDLGTTQRISLGIVFGKDQKRDLVPDKPQPQEEPDFHTPVEDGRNDSIAPEIPSSIPADSLRDAVGERPDSIPVVPTGAAKDTVVAKPLPVDSAASQGVLATDSVHAPVVAPVEPAPATPPVPVAPKAQPKPVPAKPAVPADEWDAPEQAAP